MCGPSAVDDMRAQHYPEDAAEGCEVFVPDPPKNWRCECGTQNPASDLNCVYCGLGRDDDEYVISGMQSR